MIIPIYVTLSGIAIVIVGVVGLFVVSLPLSLPNVQLLVVAWSGTAISVPNPVRTSGPDHTRYIFQSRHRSSYMCT